MWKDQRGDTHYSSFSEIVQQKKKNHDENLDAKREKFAGICPVCKQPMKWINETNVMVCSNAKCRGFEEKTKKKKEGEDPVYTPVIRLLNSGSTAYAEYLYESNGK